MSDKTDHGSSKWATVEELEERGYIGGERLEDPKKGVILGFMTDRKKQGAKAAKAQNKAIIFNDDGHRLTVARTRSGKGTTQIIPELLEHEGSVLCIDPKGENALITARMRRELIGGTTHIIDPWGICQRREPWTRRYDGLIDELEDFTPSRFNPLDMLTPDSSDLVDDAMMIADALIMPDGGDSHWSNEAKSMLMGIIIHLVTSPKEEGRRNLGRLREIISLHPSDFQNLVSVDMAEEGHELAKFAAFRMMQKSDKELSSVISTAQQNTHFLESQKMKDSLSSSDFDFGQLAQNDDKISVYLVIPPDRLKTHGRWLRLMVSMALTAMARTSTKPQNPALFLLDEFAALGKLDAVEQAYGLMAGYGMIIHAFVQDFSQLQDLYGRRWQTFIANTSMLQCFGTRDLVTAEYISKMCGHTTIEKVSQWTQKIREKGESFFKSADPNYTGMGDTTTGRPLIMPEELIRLDKDEQILILPECQPIRAGRVNYFENRYYYGKQYKFPMFGKHPDHTEPSNPKLYDVYTDGESRVSNAEMTIERIATLVKKIDELQRENKMGKYQNTI